MTSMQQDPEMPGWAKAVGFVLALPILAYACYTTYIAFAGGTMPVIGWETDGGLTSGVVWLLFVDPLIMFAGRVVWTLAMLPLVSVSD